jgi:DNA primase
MRGDTPIDEYRMRFPPSFLDEIRARLPVSEVVGRRVKLKKAGREWKGLSPFNKERTPSFFVNDQKQAWFDFSSGKNGNVFDFLIQTEGLSFPEAVERLANMAGMPLPVASKDVEEREERRKTLYEIVELAARFFEKALASSRGTAARSYLTRRGITAATQTEFRFGYAPAERFALKEHLGSQGVSVPDMIEAGLLIAGQDIPLPYDRFRDRVIIPIQDQRGRVVGFGGRTLSEEIQPKYLNSPETPIFHKGAILFNFHRARQPAHDDGSVVVVEGYMDAISIYQAGLESVVASMGTALTEEQVRQLWRLSSEPVVCFDADRAGIAAAHRSIDRVLPLLQTGQNLRFALLRGEKDPDSLIQEKGLEAFTAFLRGSLPLWDVLWEREVANASVRTPGDQAALEQRLTKLIRTIQDQTVQKSYLNICRLELARLFWQATKSRRQRIVVSQNLLPELKGRKRGLKAILLGLLVHYPQFIEEKSEGVSRVHFETDLDVFWTTLYDLLVVYHEVSVQLIYDQMKPKFYDVLEEIHGHHDANKPRGYSLMKNFPIVKIDPPLDFISRCIDHFIRSLHVDQMAEEIDDLMNSPPADPDVAASLLERVRDYQTQEERMKNEDIQLAEEAQQIRRVALGPTDYRLYVG